jgi:hypothetical protein
VPSKQEKLIEFDLLILLVVLIAIVFAHQSKMVGPGVGGLPSSSALQW